MSNVFFSWKPISITRFRITISQLFIVFTKQWTSRKKTPSCVDCYHLRSRVKIGKHTSRRVLEAQKSNQPLLFKTFSYLPIWHRGRRGSQVRCASEDVNLKFTSYVSRGEQICKHNFCRVESLALMVFGNTFALLLGGEHKSSTLPLSSSLSSYRAPLAVRSQFSSFMCNLWNCLFFFFALQ